MTTNSSAPRPGLALKRLRHTDPCAVLRMNAVARRLSASPEFRALQRRRSRLSWTLTGLVCAGYYGFILMIAFAPARFAQPIFAGTPISLGVVWGAANIVSCIVLTGLYVHRANRLFDPQNLRLVEEAQRDNAN